MDWGRPAENNSRTPGPPTRPRSGVCPTAVAIPTLPVSRPDTPARPLALWLAVAVVLFGGFMLLALVGPFSGWPNTWRYSCYSVTTLVEGVIFAAAARREVLGPSLRRVLRFEAAAFGLTSLSYAVSALVAAELMPDLPALVWAGVTFSTYAIAVLGLLAWPRVPLARGQWWLFGVDATIGAAGITIFLVVLATLSGSEALASGTDRLDAVTFGLAQMLDVVALNIVLVRGLPLPSRRAFRVFMSALILEILSLLLIQYFSAAQPDGGISQYDDATYIAVQLLYVASGLLFLWDRVESIPAEQGPSWLLTFNPLPLLALAGVAGLLVGETTQGDLAMAQWLAVALVVLVVLLAVRLIATVRENVRLVGQEAALQREKLAALRRIAGGISHEFNNMLTAVIGHAELGLSEVDPGSGVGKDLEGIRSAADRASLLTRELLSFSGGQFTGQQSLDLAALLRDLAPELRRVAGARITLMLELPGTAALRGDRGQLSEMVRALVRHAERRMPSGGTLRLALRRVVREVAVETAGAALPPGPYLWLEALDDGPGVGPQMLARLFEPFAGEEPGTGPPALGLAAVLGVVSSHGGGVSAEPTGDRGLRVAIFLPAGAEVGLAG